MNTQEAPPFPAATVKAWSEDTLARLLEQAFRSGCYYGPNPFQDMARHAAKVVLSHASAASSFLLKDAEIATLRARLAAAEKALRGALDATGRHPLLVGFAHGTPTRQELADRLSEIRAILEAALAAYDAAKGASDAG